jgi:hypothetical protein
MSSPCGLCQGMKQKVSARSSVYENKVLVQTLFTKRIDFMKFFKEHTIAHGNLQLQKQKPFDFILTMTIKIRLV